MDLDKEVIKLSCELYGNLNFNRTDVQFIIYVMKNFIKNVYNPFLLKVLDTNLFKAVDKEVNDEIHKTFEKHKNPFIKFNTEDKRLRIYKNLNMYLEPEVIPIKVEPITSTCGNKILIKETTASMIHLSVKDSIIRLLQLPGLFNEMMSYIEFLENEKLINFIQGGL